MSYLCGSFVRLEFPRLINSILCKLFVLTFGIDMSEAEFPLENYRSIEDLFTRRLKPGLRRMGSDFVSPADGVLTRSVPNAGELIQAKGLNYSAHQLVYGLEGEVKPGSDFSWSYTVYLAPHNYHRVHMPMDGKITKIRHIPGTLWPVNERFVNLVPQLFVTNERLIFEIAVANGGCAYLAMVGALNVGRITTPVLPDFATNDEVWEQRQIREFPVDKRLEVGAELGTFMLGSTVVVLLDEKARSYFQPRVINEKIEILLGQSLR